jgi:hypothetical protein
MHRFQLPYYNIAGCRAEQNEERLIEWLSERTDEEIQRGRLINTMQHGYTTPVPTDSPQWERYWNLEVPGCVELINTTGCEDWIHYRVSRFIVFDNGGWSDFPTKESECYVVIPDELLALQFKLIM